MFEVLTYRDGRLAGYADAIDGKPPVTVHVCGGTGRYHDGYLDGYADGEGVQAEPGFTVAARALVADTYPF
jgi:hypothetical protein